MGAQMKPCPYCFRFMEASAITLHALLKHGKRA
jgi:hypothetical protein